MNVTWLGLLLAVLLADSVFAQSDERADAGPRSVVISAGDEITGAGTERWVQRSRAIELDVNALHEAASTFDVRPRLIFDLFDEVSMTIELRDANVISPNRFTVHGVIPRVVGSSAIFSVRHDAVHGVVTVPHVGVFEIRHDGDGVHRVVELDPVQMPSCGVGGDQVISLPNGAAAAQQTEGGEPVVIDVMVVYTPAALAEAGSQGGMLAAIDTAMAQTSAAAGNSEVNVQFNLVFTAEIDYEESGSMGTDLERFQEQNNGYMDDVHQWRAEVGADLVALVNTYDENPVCGIAYLMTDPSLEFEQWAFSVTRLECIANMTFAHELGHNIGCHHDHANVGGSSGAFPYSHGHRFVGDSGTEWRTVMAYLPGQRISNFSNPNVLHDGQPTGVPAAQPDEADNALTMNNNAVIVSEFTASVGTACEWNDLDGGVDSAVWALAEYNGDLIAGGDFSTAGGVTAPRIARWDGNQWNLLGAANTTVRALEIYEGDLIAGGQFSILDGMAVSRIARYDGSDWHPLEEGLSGGSNPRVFDMTVFDNDLYVAGTFLTAGEQTVNRIARWDGSEWHALDGGMNNNVYALTAHQEQLIAAGSFTNAGGVPVNRIARWDGQQWHPIGGGMPDVVFALESFDGDLIAGGQFTGAGGAPASYIARWNGSAWNTLDAGVDDVVQAMTVHEDNLFVGGSFSSASSIASSRLARWDGEQWNAVGIGVNNVVRAVSVYQSDLVVGGSFTAAGGETTNRIATVNCDLEECAFADLNCDGFVNTEDLFILLGEWGACDDVDDCPADLNNDSVVNTEDLFLLLANWG